MPEGKALQQRVMQEDPFPSEPCEPVQPSLLLRFYDLGWEAQKGLAVNLAGALDQAELAAIPELLAALYTPSGERLERLEPDTAHRLIDATGTIARRAAEDPAQRVRICEIALSFLEGCIDPAKSSYAARAAQALRAVAEAAPDPVREDRLLRLVLGLLHETHNDLLRITALNLLPGLLGFFSPTAVEGFLSTEILSLMQDQRTEVKLAAFRSFFAVVERLDSDLLARKFLDILAASKGDYANDVRIVVTRHIATLARRLPPALFEQQLFDSFLLNLDSRNRFVREEALAQLGALLSVLADRGGSPRVERLYAAFFELPRTIAKLSPVARLPVVRANYPFLGRVFAPRRPARWEALLRFLQATEELEPALAETAKTSVAQQLESLAAADDDNRFERDLLPLIDRRYLVGSERVKLVALRALPALLGRVAGLSRERYADLFYETMDQDTRKWRTRFLVAGQAAQLAQLFQPETVVAKVLPMYFSFCRDNVATVRKAAAGRFASFLRALEGRGEALSVALAHMKAFAAHSHSVFRQVFVLLFQSLVVDEARHVDEEMRAIVRELAVDPLLPVRVQVALFLAQTGRSAAEGFRAELVALLADCPDSDVVDALREASGELRFRLKPSRALRFPGSAPQNAAPTGDTPAL